MRRRHRVWVCGAGHSYDIARSGYVNLLQPQDRRAAAAGDTREAVEARAALLSAGVGQALIDAVARHAGRMSARAIVDLGCGSGDALAAVTADAPDTGIGIDLSSAAIERAARRFPDRLWIVANADRRLPLPDASVDLVMSVHGRRNPAEAARVLAPSGALLVAVPAAEDLIELRELVQGQRLERDRAGGVITEHRASFELVERSIVRETLDLDPAALRLLLRGTYRGARRRAAERADALGPMAVTLASDVLTFRLR